VVVELFNLLDFQHLLACKEGEAGETVELRMHGEQRYV
jgi:hypothetical protein